MAGTMHYKTWMADLPARLTDVPISCLAIPGSHDSGTSKLDPSLGVAVDQAGIVKSLAGTCCGSSIIHNWSKTQNLSITEQLNAGIRFLDFRVAKHPTSKEIRIVHGLYGDTVQHVLQMIRTFVDDNQKEIIILDFNHFYNMNSMDHAELLKDVHDVLNVKLVPAPDYNTWLPRWGMTLSSIWATDFRVIVVYRDEKYAGSFRDIWPKYRIESPWPNTTKSDDLIRFFEDIYTNQRRFSNDDLYNWQGVLTPSTGSIVLHLGSSLEKCLSEDASRKFVSWLKHQIPGPGEINICTMDFVEKFDFISTVIALNNKIVTYPTPIHFS